MSNYDISGIKVPDVLDYWLIGWLFDWLFDDSLVTLTHSSQDCLRLMIIGVIWWLFDSNSLLYDYLWLFDVTYLRLYDAYFWLFVLDC